MKSLFRAALFTVATLSLMAPALAAPRGKASTANSAKKAVDKAKVNKAPIKHGSKLTSGGRLQSKLAGRSGKGVEAPARAPSKRFSNSRLTSAGLLRKAQGGELARFASETMGRNEAQLSSALRSLQFSPAAVDAAVAGLRSTATSMSAQFGENGPLVNANPATRAIQVRATERIHAGYVAAEIGQALKLKPRQIAAVRDALIKSGPKVGMAGLDAAGLDKAIAPIARALPARLRQQGTEFLKNGNGWMLGEYGFGDVDVAKNQAAVHAGEATISFAQQVLRDAGKPSSREAAIDAIRSTLSKPLPSIGRMLEGKAGTRVDQAIVHMSLRSANAGWFAAIGPQAVGEAKAAVGKGQGSSNKGAKRVFDKNYTDFEQMKTSKGLTEVAKDRVQVLSYLHHLSLEGAK